MSRIKTDVRFYEDMVLKTQPDSHDLTTEDLADVFAPLQEWDFLLRTDKRRILQAVVPEIHVQDYRVTGLAILAESTRRNEVTRRGTGSWPRRA